MNNDAATTQEAARQHALVHEFECSLCPVSIDEFDTDTVETRVGLAHRACAEDAADRF